MTDNRTTELLPCPICGRKATVSSWWSDAEECGIAGVGCSKESYVNGYECARIIVMRIDEKTALEDAIRIWNTRVEPNGGTCDNAELQAAYDAITAKCAELCRLCGFEMVDAAGEVIA